jgi:hypothetical protein
MSEQEDPPSLPLLTTVQRQRVDEAFVELFGHPFSCNDATRVTSNAPQWLCDVLSSEKMAAQVWKQLSLRKKRQLATRVLGKRSLFRTVPRVPATKAGDDDVVTTRIEQNPKNIAIDTTSSTNTTTATSNRTSLAARVQLLTSDKASTSTLVKTALDWELYKSQSEVMAATLEEQATQKTAYLPKQEFLQRVDIRQYEKSRSTK